MVLQSKSFSQLNQWYEQPLGQSLAQTMADELAEPLAKGFGYHLLQLGVTEHRDWLHASPIKHKIFLENALENFPASVFGDFEEIPLRKDSVDVVVLPHTLEYVPEPREVLAEVDRVLIPEGHLIIVGFNPMSLWGLAHVFKKFNKTAPWNAKLISSMKMQRYLREIGFTIVSVKSFMFRPPINNPKLFEKFLFLESFGRLVWPYPGGIYMMVAKKEVSKLTPIKPIWGFRSLVIGRRYGQPSTNLLNKGTRE